MRTWPKICGDVRSADQRRPIISDVCLPMKRGPAGVPRKLLLTASLLAKFDHPLRSKMR